MSHTNRIRLVGAVPREPRRLYHQKECNQQKFNSVCCPYQYCTSIAAHQRREFCSNNVNRALFVKVNCNCTREGNIAFSLIFAIFEAKCACFYFQTCPNVRKSCKDSKNLICQRKQVFPSVEPGETEARVVQTENVG